MMSPSEKTETHIFFFPFLARGHTIPMVETARLFSERPGVVCTVVTTPGNSTYFQDTVDRAGPDLRLLLIPFPAADVGLPAGVESTFSLPDNSADLFHRLVRGVDLLRPPFHLLAAAQRPDAIVSDAIVLWPADVAADLSVPHFEFFPFSPFSIAVVDHIFLHNLDTAAGTGPLTGLPHQISLTSGEVPPYNKTPDVLDKMRDSQRKSRGLLFNSFYELAPEYVDHLVDTNLSGGKMDVFCLGPVRAGGEGGGRSWERIKSWLDAKDPGSVLYVSFGSEYVFGAEQLREIALGLAGSAHPFVWVVQGGRGGGDTVHEWLPEGFYDKSKGRGMIVTEWAPQVAILNHRATGGMILHCGWNSTMEAICAGLPVIAWPLHSEQFINERLVVDVLGTGIRILEGEEVRRTVAPGEVKGVVVRAETVRAAVDRLMGGGDEEDEGVKKMKSTAKKYKEMARAATEEGGSSYANIGKLIEQINKLRA